MNQLLGTARRALSGSARNTLRASSFAPQRNFVARPLGACGFLSPMNNTPSSNHPVALSDQLAAEQQLLSNCFGQSSRGLSTSAWRANKKPNLPVVNSTRGPKQRDGDGENKHQMRRRGNDRVGGNRRENKPASESEYIAKRLVTRVISVDAVRKTTAGGRVNRFRAIVAAGNGAGAAGFGFGKALTTRAAIAKALAQAKKRWVAIELREDNGLYHDVMGKFNNTRVLLRSSKPFNGLRAGGIVRGICDVFGIQNSTTKVIGRTTPSSVVYACFHALAQHKTPIEVQEIRGRKLFRSNRWMF